MRTVKVINHPDRSRSSDQPTTTRVPTILRCWMVAMMVMVATGCSVPPPGGSVVHPEMLGSKVDQIHAQQEENAELAKLIIYAHEFEINLQEDVTRRAASKKSKSTYNYHAKMRPRGLRLTPAGEDHVKKIAEVLRNGDHFGAPPHAVVQRSETSKRWDTEHQYPVHRNSELDAMRRQVVVKTLETMGIPDANERVLVAPAFPTGIGAIDAANAYRRSLETQGNNDPF